MGTAVRRAAENRHPLLGRWLLSLFLQRISSQLVNGLSNCAVQS
jgi:hypothetical protein